MGSVDAYEAPLKNPDEEEGKEPADMSQLHTTDDRASSLDGLGGRIVPSDICGLGDIPAHEEVHGFFEDFGNTLATLEEDALAQNDAKDMAFNFVETSRELSHYVKKEIKIKAAEKFSHIFSGEFDDVKIFVNQGRIDLVGARDIVKSCVWKS